MAAALLSLAGLVPEVPQKQLLGLDLQLAAGECVALLGPSGSGKSTTLRTLAWLQSPRAGRVQFRKKTPLQWGVPQWRAQVLYLSQRAPWFSGTVGDNCRRLAGYAGKNFSAAIFSEQLDSLGLRQDQWQQSASELSEGEKQRFALLRALAVEPSVLLLDEPTAALDLENALAYEQVVQRWLKQGERAIVLVSHSPEQIERMAHKKIVLQVVS